MNQYYPTNVLKIPNATPETKDAAQYMIRDGKHQFNLCGEFCVAYCSQDKSHTDNIDEFLDYWKAKDLKWYQAVFQNGLGRTTSLYDLDMMLRDYGYSVPSSRVSNLPTIVPDYIESVLESYRIIMGVQIDYGGYLVGKGIPHWVVLNAITVIDYAHAICDIYNPYTNAIEPYSWKELMTSTGAYKQGILVAR